MTEVLHANIFFFITGIAVIVFTTLLCVALFHFIKVLKSLRRIMDRVDAGTEVIAEDMQNVRVYLTEDGLIPRIINTFMGNARNGARGGRKNGKQDKKDSD